MRMEAYLLDATYRVEDGEPVIHLFLSDEDDAFLARYRGFRPYLYVIPEEGEADAIEERLRDLAFEANGDPVEVTEVEQQELKDGKEEVTALKTFVNVPPSVPKVKDEVKEWEELNHLREFDIPFYKRFLFNKGLQPPSKVVVEGEQVEYAEFDGITINAESVEEQDPEDLPDPSMLAFDLEVYDDEIIMCSFYGEGYRKVLVSHDDGFSKEYVETVDDERALLRRLQEVINDRDPDV
ncbi:MAG: 3'-5' exonuclease, partial [Candidatus Nanohaloarchaea archaeon]|nr:3'-5' exonuclease [Candidatus Nanohaloarchaea archaeon]